jgi:hypothetical protein
MPMGQIFFSSNMSAPLTSRWKRIHRKWCQKWGTLRVFTCEVEAPGLYTERSLVGMWGTAMAAAYPRGGLAVAERPVNKKQNLSGRGLLDLWLAIHEQPYVFDLAVEAKPYNVCALNAKNAALKLFSVAMGELVATQQTKVITWHNAGAAVGIVKLRTQSPMPKRSTLDKFVDDVWVLLQQHATGHIAGGGHLVFGTYRIPKGFCPWKGRTAVAAYTLFLIRTAT